MPVDFIVDDAGVVVVTVSGRWTLSGSLAVLREVTQTVRASGRPVFALIHFDTHHQPFGLITAVPQLNQHFQALVDTGLLRATVAVLPVGMLRRVATICSSVFVGERIVVTDTLAEAWAEIEALAQPAG